MLDYLSIPVWLQYSSNLEREKGIRWFAGIGLSGSLRVGGKIQASDLSNPIDPVSLRELGLSNNPNTFDAGAHGRLGIGVPLLDHELTLQAEYYHGFMPHYEDGAHNRTLSLAVGYLVTL